MLSHSLFFPHWTVRGLMRTLYLHCQTSLCWFFCFVTVCCFFLLTRGWGRLEKRPPVALGSEASPGLFAFTMSLTPPVHPSPIFLTNTENVVGSSAIPARSCPGPVWYHWRSIIELEVPPDETTGLTTLHPHNTNVLQSITDAKSPYPPDRSN